MVSFRVLFIVLGTLPLSGCMGGTGPLVTQGPSPQFDETTGAIVGVVIDDQYAPVEGAHVGIVGQASFTTATNARGEFALNHVPPGSHDLAVQRLGFEPAIQRVTIEAGSILDLRIFLVPVEIPVPRTELRLFNGYISCAVAVVRTTLPLNNCRTAQNTTNWHELYPKGWPSSFKGVLIEADWKTGDDTLAFDFNDRAIGYYGVYYRTRDQSPLRFLVERCGDYRKDHFGRAPMPCTDDQVNASRMHIETFYGGRFQQQTHAADPACRENVSTVLPGYQAGCYGAGVAFDLRWNNYVSIFHLEIPKELDKYSGRPDK